MKKVYFLFASSFLFVISLLAQCPTNNLVLSTQQQVDDFAITYPDCTTLEHDLIIFGDINNLNGLQDLTTISGDLRIQQTTGLSDLSGLENLQTITGVLTLSQNEALSSLDGLESLIGMIGGLMINDNSLLNDISSLQQITSTVASLSILASPGLIDLDDLSGITSIGNTFGISNNLNLTTIFPNGSQLQQIGNYLSISNNPALNNLQSLSSISSLRGILISRCGNLTNLQGLENILTMNQELNLSDNDGLTSLQGLQNLSSVQELRIFGNDALVDLNGLSSLQTVEELAEISDNDGLINLQGTALEQIGGLLRIERNSQLIDLTGLELITSLPGGLDININSRLESLQGLNALTNVGGMLNLQSLNSLTDMSALGSLQSVAFSLEITANDALLDFDVFNSLTSIGGRLNINDNDNVIQLTGFNSLTSLGTDLYLVNNSRCENISGFNALSTINGDLFLSTNQRLIAVDAFAQLTSLGGLRVSFSDDLMNLSFLSNVASMQGEFIIDNNTTLSALAGTEGIDLSAITNVRIESNQNLALCNQENLCQYILNGGATTIGGNAATCDEVNDLLLGCFSGAPFTNLVGTVLADIDGDCTAAGEELSLAGWLVEVSHENYNYTVSTDEDGRYWIPTLAGENTLNVISNSPFWTACTSNTIVVAEAMYETIETDLRLFPQGNCSYINWDVTVPALRICATRTVSIDYCNEGALPGDDIIISVLLDETLEVVSASEEYTLAGDGSLLFTINDIGLFSCNTITLEVFSDCEEAMIGDSGCIAVEILGEELCPPDENWDGSLITANGFCLGDSIFFDLQNIGSGSMSQPAQFRAEIVIDDIVLMFDADDYQLANGESKRIGYLAQEQGIRLEADQTPNHPLYTEVSAVVANCEDSENTSILALLPSNNGDPFAGVFCAPFVNSYDPNIKSVHPLGLGVEHEIDKDWQLDYTIQFQNTGNDVAYLVVIKDTLSEQLDLSTIKVGAASHDFTWELSPNRELVFTFADINLPDSTSNEPASHGYVDFSILPRQDLLPGAEIENHAAIFFDFNDPIITNSVDHRIRKPVVVSNERQVLCQGHQIGELNIQQDTTLKYLTAFAEYDSLHFLHVEVLSPQTTNDVFLSIPYGSIFEQVFITQDTSFSVSYVSASQCDSLVNYQVSVLTNTEEGMAFAQLKLFPNPVTDVLQLSPYEIGTRQAWSLFNALGQKVWQRSLSANERLGQVDVSQFSAGLYHLRVRTNDAQASWKIVVEE